MAIFSLGYFHPQRSLRGFGAASGTILVRIAIPRDADRQLVELKVPYEVQDVEWPVLKFMRDGSRLMVFSSRRGDLPSSVNLRSDREPTWDVQFINAQNKDLDMMPPPSGGSSAPAPRRRAPDAVAARSSMPAEAAPVPQPLPVVRQNVLGPRIPAAAAAAAATMPQQIPAEALVQEPAPSSRSMMPSAPPPTGAAAADLQRGPGTRVTVSPEFVDSLVEKFPQYFNFPDQPQGSVSTSSASEATSVDRPGSFVREPIPLEQLREGAPTYRVATPAYCLKKVPEGMVGTGEMAPVDANCNCPEGFERIGQCPVPQSSGSKWWILLLVGAGVWAYSRRK